jgi:hypothetical protein
MRKNLRNAKRSLVLFAMMLVLACSGSVFASATITINNLDGPAERVLTTRRRQPLSVATPEPRWENSDLSPLRTPLTSGAQPSTVTYLSSSRLVSTPWRRTCLGVRVQLSCSSTFLAPVSTLGQSLQTPGMAQR